MKSLTAVSVLLSVFSLSPDVAPADLHPEAHERIETLVVEPLQQRTIFWRPTAFSRALIAVEPVELRLWTSPPATDANDRAFVPFRIEALENDETSSFRVRFTGCYYPAIDAAFLEVDGVRGAVPIDEHPWLTLRTVDAGDETACRAKE